MAAEPEEHGIEATDLSSLLCRFEEATNSEINLDFLNSCMPETKPIKYRSKIIQLSRNISDKLSSGNNILQTKRTTSNETLLPSPHSGTKSTSAASTYFESPCCLVESPPSAPILAVSPEITTLSQIKLEAEPSSFTGRTTECRDMLISGKHEISPAMDILESIFAQNEFLFQDAVSLHDFSTNADMLSSAIKTEFTDDFLEIFASDDLSTNNALFSTVAMSDVNDTHLSCNSISGLLHQSSIFPVSGDGGETCLHDIDIKNCNSDICLVSSLNNLHCDQSSLEHATSDSQLWDIFMGLEHSYCSKMLPATECVIDASEHSSFTAFMSSPEHTIAYPDEALTQSISDVLDDSSSVSQSTNADTFFTEEQEICIDSNGNDLYSHPPNQSPGCETLSEHFSRLESIDQTPEKDTHTKLESSHEHTQSNALCITQSSAGPVSEDAVVFFDKIPSYYTALSISSKPLTTTVFASATKHIGSTDHLDMWDSSEPPDDSRYDKVPAHRRCFTNTAKEVEIKTSSSYHNDVPTSHEPEGDLLPNSSTRESVIIPLTVENVAAANVKYSKRSHSPHSKTPALGRCSRSPIRRSASTSRFSRHSASSVSACSTCSSCSSCSTCSLSRSCSSSGSERGSSLCSDYRTNRSRSPVARNNRFSVETTRYNYTSSSEDPAWRSKRHKSRSKHNSAMDMRMLKKRKLKEEEQAKAMEERRIVYVGKIPDGYTKKQLYQRFQSFGEIKQVKVNFREHGDNYGFVTFAYSCDAVAAKEKGNSMPGVEKFDLCFGGRRHFCPDQYADLDGNREIEEEYAPMPIGMSQELDYAALLKQHSSTQMRK
ncbi:hypothetical protein BsWGS_04859 [Bradybaena similaris]